MGNSKSEYTKTRLLRHLKKREYKLEFYHWVNYIEEDVYDINYGYSYIVPRDFHRFNLLIKTWAKIFNNSVDTIRVNVKDNHIELDNNLILIHIYHKNITMIHKLIPIFISDSRILILHELGIFPDQLTQLIGKYIDTHLTTDCFKILSTI